VVKASTSTLRRRCPSVLVFRLHRLHAVRKMRPVATDVARSGLCVCVCVCVSVCWTQG